MGLKHCFFVRLRILQVSFLCPPKFLFFINFVNPNSIDIPIGFLIPFWTIVHFYADILSTIIFLYRHIDI
jgi:hypothetical protein